MKVVVTTNLDLEPNEKWPSDMPVLPRVGDYIESAHGWGKAHLSLIVSSIRWRAINNNWVPHIELGVPRGVFETMNGFYEWYKKLTNK